MALTATQLRLCGIAVAAIVLLCAGVPLLTPGIAAPWSFVAVMGAYWLIFCIPVIAIFVRPAGLAGLLSFSLSRRALWVPVLLAVQLVGVFFGAFWPHLGELTLPALALAALVGLINGPLEELAWRGGFLKVFGRTWTGSAIGWVLFSLWHLALILIGNIAYEGGGATLVAARRDLASSGLSSRSVPVRSPGRFRRISSPMSWRFPCSLRRTDWADPALRGPAKWR